MRAPGSLRAAARSKDQAEPQRGQAERAPKEQGGAVGRLRLKSHAEFPMSTRGDDKRLGGGIDLVRGELGIAYKPAQALIKGAAGNEQTLILCSSDRKIGEAIIARRGPALLRHGHPRAGGAHAVDAGLEAQGAAGGVPVGIDEHRLGGIHGDLHAARHGDIANEHTGIVHHLLEEELVHIRRGIRYGHHALDGVAFYLQFRDAGAVG